LGIRLLELKGAGKPIPASDLWIAALSRQHAIPGRSRDSHFDYVGALRRQTHLRVVEVIP